MGLIITSAQKANIKGHGNGPEFGAGRLLPSAFTWASPGARRRSGGPVRPRSLRAAPAEPPRRPPLARLTRSSSPDLPACTIRLPRLSVYGKKTVDRKGRETIRVPAPQGQ